MMMDDSTPGAYTLGDYLLPLLYLVAIAWYLLFWAVALLGWSTARRVYTRRPRSPLSSAHPESVPGVSIIRPLKGLDPNLYENLESSFLQEYSNFEVIFSVHDKNDQALRVVEELVQKYPAVPVQVVTNERVVGVNPKINNLVTPFERAHNDIVWVLDSNVYVQPGTLARSVEALTHVYPTPYPTPSFSSSSPSSSLAADPQPMASMHSKFRQRVGVVHHVPFVKLYPPSAHSTPSPSSRFPFSLLQHPIGAQIEAAFINTTHAKMYIAINQLAIESCVMGKSNMYRRSDIARLTGLASSRGQWRKQKPIPALDARTGRPNRNAGEPTPPSYPADVTTGLEAFSEFLAEDNMLAAALMHELGLLHAMSCDVAINAVAGSMSLSGYLSRRVRWIRVRKHMVLSATLLEPFQECFALALIGAYTLGSLAGVHPAIWCAAHVACWLAVDLGVYAALAGHPLPTTPPSAWWAFVGAWLLRETLALPVWIMGVVGSEVTWRGERYMVRRNGKVRRVEGAKHGQRGYELLPGGV